MLNVACIFVIECSSELKTAYFFGSVRLVVQKMHQNKHKDLRRKSYENFRTDEHGRLDVFGDTS